MFKGAGGRIPKVRVSLAVPLSLLLNPQSGSTAGELGGNLQAKLENQRNLEELVLRLQS